jgi:ABC-type cobalamin/Fe3+-siderophores transport system ATPase subunit
MGHPETVLTPDCLSQVYDVTVVVTPHSVYGTPLIAPVFASEQKWSNEGDKPSDDT